MMTREEAIASYEKLYAYMVGDDDAIELDYGEFMELNHYILSALRPVSREQVEKVWRSEWIGDDDKKVGTIDGSPIKSATCSACGNWLVGSDEYDCSGYFCPRCGAAMTDEAVQMVMERMEALHETD